MELKCYDINNQQITHLTQWDLNQQIIIHDLDIPETSYVHAANAQSKFALVCKSSYDSATNKLTFEVPNILLQKELSLKIYIYVVSPDSSAKTIHTIRIPVIPRAKPAEYIYEDNFVYVTPDELQEAFEDIQDALKQIDEALLSLPDDAMKQSIYDPDNKKQNIFKYADDVLSAANTYTDEALKNYHSITINIVSQLPATGVPYTIYFIPKAGGGYKKYWWIINSGVGGWDEIGGSSTIVVESLPTGQAGDPIDPSANYVVKTDSGYLLEKYINNRWEIIGGSLIYIDDVLPPVENGSEHTDYYIGTNNAYIHYRFIDGNFCVVGGDSYSKSDIDNKIKILSDSISTLATETNKKLSEIDADINDYEDRLGLLEGQPNITYDVDYDNIEDENVGENMFVLYEIENANTDNPIKTIKRKFPIKGGGGDSSGNNFIISYDKNDSGQEISKYVFTTKNLENNQAIIYYTFSGTDSSGASVSYANATWQVRKGTSGSWTTLLTETIYPGEDIPFNISKYVGLGTYQISVTATDDFKGYAAKVWTIQTVDVRIESSFNDKDIYPIGKIDFTYTPWGAISKDIYFLLDGIEIKKVTTASSGSEDSIEIPAQTHGSHLLEAYIIGSTNSGSVGSERIYKDIIFYDDDSTVPIIGCAQQEITVQQHDTVTITFTVYDPSSETPSVEIAEDGNVVDTRTLTESNTDNYIYQASDVFEEGETSRVHTITIKCGDTTKTLTVTVKKININATPVTAGLAFDFNPIGHSNNGDNRLWSDGVVSMSVSDDFDWVNGGYQIDENGDQFFCIKSGDRATIDYKLFADDAKKNGKEFKLIFKTANVAKPDATFLHCLSDSINTTEGYYYQKQFYEDDKYEKQIVGISNAHYYDKHSRRYYVYADNEYTEITTGLIGIRMDAHEAFIHGQTGKLRLPYSEDDIIEFEFNISKDTEDIPMVMGYEDGVSTCPMVYDDSHNFTQNAPKSISLGSDDCDLHIYRFKVYNSSLTDRGILNNFITDARNAKEMIARDDRNQIYDENQSLDPDVLAEKCPWLRIIKIEAPYFTNHKDNKVPNTTVEYIYKNGKRPADNWKATDAVHSGQGTSSNNYGAAGRNLDIIVKRVRDKTTGLYLNENPIFTLSDNTKTNKVSLTENSVPVNYFNIKVNIASSNNLTNAMLAKKYNEFNPYNRAFIREDESEISKIKDTMEFHNCVVFIKESDTDLSTHREFADNDWHFYAIGNIGDSKKTDNTRLTDPDDKYECCVEIMDVEYPLSDFPVNTMYNAMGYTEDEITHERIYTWAKNENLNILHEYINGEYVLTTDTEVDLTKTYYVDILEHDDFSEDFTYGWRYIYEDGTDEENAEVFDYCKQKWIDLYRFITTSTDDEFRAGLSDYFVLNSALYYYLFTTRYCMIDNRAKNSFWHYGKTGEVDDYDNPIRKWDLNWGYDMDSSLGLNNYGMQVYRYGLEDTDVDEKGEEIFREMDSTFFCRLRDLFEPELKSMYNALDNAWNAAGFINQCDEWQSEFPEELWRLDIERKYIRTYNRSFINGKGEAQFLVNMANGKMKYHRRQWERSQEKYMASKYQSATASGDNAVFRCSVPTGDLVVQPNYRLKLTPYAYMYLNVKYGTQSPIQLRAEPNITYEIPFDGNKADIIDIYSSSLIQDFGDLSSCYIATADTSKATKVKRLILGNKSEGYNNPHFTTLTTGANYLLEELNVENVSGLTQSLNLSALSNLKELYAHGSSISGVTFADGGKIKVAELPAINSLTMKNLIYLTTLDITDLTNLSSLTAENCDTVDLQAILNLAHNLQRIRITDIDWVLEDTSLLNRLYTMSGFDKDGYNTSQSVLTGKVHINGQVRNQELLNYENSWKDLDVSYNPENLVTQYPVTYVNADDKMTVLFTTYVDRGATPPDPYAEGWIEKPTLESDVQYDYSFGTEANGEYVYGSGWNEIESAVLEPRTVTAAYQKTLREYTVTWYSHAGISLGSKKATYGSEVVYDGEIPTRTDEESIYVFNLFKGWDKSTGYITGNVDVYAVWDRASMPPKGKDLKDMTPAEIYAVTSTGNTTEYFVDKDYVDITLGCDFNFDPKNPNRLEPGEVKSELLAENLFLDGSTAITKDIQLFGENEKTFTMAIDFQFISTNSGDTLVSAYKETNDEGFRLYYDSYPKIQWGDATPFRAGYGTLRNMLVLRHIKGENKLYIYASDTATTFSPNISVGSMTRTRSTYTDVNTSFGGVEFSDGYDFYGKGIVHWCKIWYDDLGDTNCRKLANWTRESLRMEYCGTERYRLGGDTTKKASASFICNKLLADRGYSMQATEIGNTGGWKASLMRQFLNDRVYKAFPDVWKSMIKLVKIKATDGGEEGLIETSEDFIYLPCRVEMGYSINSNIYNKEGDRINWFLSLNSIDSHTRIKSRRFVIPDGYTYYRCDSDPFITYQNEINNEDITIKSGDIWGISDTGVKYIYVSQEYIDKHSIKPNYISTHPDGSPCGGWIAAEGYWLRTAPVDFSGFSYIPNTGLLGSNHYSGGDQAICPCFSV